MKQTLTILSLLFSLSSIAQPFGMQMWAQPIISPTTVWSTINHGSSAVISGIGNNTYTNSTSTANCGLGTISELASGDHLYEVYITFTGLLTLVGVGTISTNTGSYAGADANAWAYDTYGGTGFVYHNGSGTALTGCGVSSGTYVEVELNAGGLYIYLNGTLCNGSAAIATGLSGSFYPVFGYLNDVAVINGNATTFQYPISGKNTSTYSWK